MVSKRIRLVAAILLAGSFLLFATASASAQDRARRPARGETVTEHIFDDADEIVGDTPGAEGIRAVIRLPGQRSSLIEYRTHFRDSLLKSVEIL